MNCIYYCLYGDINYKKILELSVSSSHQFMNKESIYVFTEFDIPELEPYCNLVKIKFPDGFANPMAYRLILGKQLLQKFDNILHLDADTLTLQNLDDIFHCFSDNKISFSTEAPDNPAKIIGQYWAGPLLTEEEKVKYCDVNSLCCGVFGFNKSMYEHLDSIYKFIEECESSGFKGICRDQHGFTTYVLKNSMYNYNLENYVCHIPSLGMDKKKYKIYHFAGGVISGNKYNQMKEFIEEYNNETNKK